MLARIAQELFWLGRDLTRAEHTARILDGAFHADVAGAPGERGIALSWEGVLATIGAKPPRSGEEEPAVAETATPASRSFGRAEVARLLTLDTDSPASVVSCVARARERGRTMRDVISTEMWEALNSFYLLLGRYDLQAALRTGPVLGLPGGQGALRAVLGAASTGRCCATRAARSWRPAAASRRPTWSCGCSRVGDPARAARRGAHETEALALLHAVGGFQAYRRAVRAAPTVGAGRSAFCSSTPPIRARSPPRWRRWPAALIGGRRAAAVVAAGAAARIA